MTADQIAREGSAARRADYRASNGSNSRLLQMMTSGGLYHCTLQAGKTSSLSAHDCVKETWFVLEEQRDVWRKNSAAEETVRVCAGLSLTIPARTAFQFRNTGDSPLCILIVTMPPWPGPQEAEKAEGVWPVTVGAAADTGSASVVAELGAQTRGRRDHK